MSNKSMQMKTYSRKSMSRSSAQFDALISSATSSTKTAVSVSRWGQTTFTSVRRQNELENNSNNNNNNNNNNSNNNSNNDRIFQDSKRPKIEKFDNLKEKSIETKTLIKPKVNKFFKSRSNITNALFDDIVKEKIIRDKEENRFLTINNTCNEKKEIEVKPKSWKPLNETQTKKSERKSREINYKKLDDEKYISGNDINKNDKKTNSNKNNSNSVKKNISQNSVPIRGTRSSRRLQGADPEVVQEVNKLKCFNTLETENNEILTINQPIVDSCLSDITTNSVSININQNQNQLTIDNNLVEDEICSLKTDSNSDNMELDINNDLTQTISDSKSSSQSSDNDFKFVEPKSLSQPIPESSHQNFNNDKQIPSSNSQPESTSSSSSSSQVIVTKPKKKIFSSSKKNRAVFNMKNFWSSDSKEFSDELQASDQSVASSSSASNDNKKSVNDFDFDDDSNYIKLHRVKKAHQCHDLGETEQFDDDIKYHLSGIESSNTIPMRCLSILGLTRQAMRPEFRMHLRAHDDMPRIISALMDAPTDANLALCTATLMFVYSQDRLTMDIDPNALSLMLQLLETRSDECNQVEIKHRNKVKDLCEQMKNKGHAKYLKLNEITAGKLAMETLLSLTSKRAGDWFKEELRRIKGIDFILDTVLRCSEFDENEGHMIKIDRCMHVLENVTFNNIENQEYILKYKDGLLTSTCIKLLHSCKYQIILYNDSKVFLSAFFSILRVLTHLTSESADGCLIIGTYDGIIDLLLESVFELPSFIMSDQRFDLMVILLCLCINLVEFCPTIRNLVVNSNSKLNLLIELLFKRIEEAQRTEQQTDELLESHESVQMTEAMQDSLLKQMLSQSGNHMEHSIIAACVSLLLGCCIQDNTQYTNIVRNNLPNLSFDPLVEVLQKLRDFAYLADIMTKKGKERVDRIIQVFKSL